MIRATNEYKELLKCLELEIDFCIRTNLLVDFTHIDYEINNDGNGVRVIYFNKQKEIMKYEMRNMNIQALKVLKYGINRFNSFKFYESEDY